MCWQLIQTSDTTVLGLVFLQTASEELVCPWEDLSISRKEELRRLLLAHMPQVFSILTGIVLLSYNTLQYHQDCWWYRPRNSSYSCSFLLSLTVPKCFGFYLTIFRQNIQFWFFEIITLTTDPLFYILFFIIVLGLTVCFYMVLKFGQYNSILTVFFLFFLFLFFFPSIPPGKFRDGTSVRPLLLPRKSFQINCFYHPIIWRDVWNKIVQQRSS
jgi:hypothetical protein